MGEGASSRVEEMLELLADELEERILSRAQAREAEEERREEAPQSPLAALADASDGQEGAQAGEPEPTPAPLTPGELVQPPEPSGPLHAARAIGRLALGLLIALVLINIPLSRRGTTLATAMPDSASMVIRDGLVVKEEGREEIYVYQDGRFRWISSMDAFEHYGFTWQDVHVVEDGFLDHFAVGQPLHVLLKCATSPHIYRVEGGVKRWIVDIETFEAEGHVWEDVRHVLCQRLRNLPDGDTIPPGQGPPPQP